MPIVIKQSSLDDWMFYLLCLFSLMLGITVAGANIPLGLLCPLFLYRLYRDPPRWKDLRTLDHGFFLTFGAFILATILSLLFSEAKIYPFIVPDMKKSVNKDGGMRESVFFFLHLQESLIQKILRIQSTQS